MPRVEFKPTTPVFERAKTVHFDRAAGVIGAEDLYCTIIYLFRTPHALMEIKFITGSTNPRHYFLS
jgi:hypothetical protein